MSRVASRTASWSAGAEAQVIHAWAVSISDAGARRP